MAIRSMRCCFICSGIVLAARLPPSALAESSTRGDRENFKEMIAFVKSQTEPVAIVLDKVDRLRRSHNEAHVLDDLIKSNLIKIHFNSEG